MYQDISRPITFENTENNTLIPLDVQVNSMLLSVPLMMLFLENARNV